MTASPRFVAADEANELPTDISELLAMIAALPADSRARIEPVLARVIDSTKRRRRILALVQDALSQLRLDMKYLVFDLEATRRERDDFKDRLKQHGEFGSEESGENPDQIDDGSDFTR